MCNPRLVSASPREIFMTEGCLSFPGISGGVSRPESVEYEFQNAKGELRTKVLSGWEARMLWEERSAMRSGSPQLAPLGAGNTWFPEQPPCEGSRLLGYVSTILVLF